MAQWTFVDPNTLLPGSPWTSAKAQAAFENLEAVTEGADNAPRVRGSAFRHNLLAEFDTESSFVEGPIEFINLQPSMGFVIEVADARGRTFDGGGDPALRGVVCAVSNNNGSSYTTFQTTPSLSFDNKLFMLMFGPPRSFRLSDSVSEFSFNGPANAVRFSTSNPLNPPNEVMGSFRIFSLVRERE